MDAKDTVGQEPKQADKADLEGMPIPSGPPGLPIIGNLRDLTGSLGNQEDNPGHDDRGLHMHLSKMVAEYGGFFKIQIPSGMINLPVRKLGETVVLADPDLLQEMFDRPDVFQKRLFKHSALRGGMAGTGLFTTDDDEPIHDQAARVLLPAFSMKGMQEYFALIMETTEVLEQQFIEQSADGVLDLHPLLSRYTFDIIGQVGFGMNFHALTGPSRFMDLFTEFAEAQVRLSHGIGGCGGKFRSTKVIAGLMTGELMNFKRLSAKMKGEMDTLMADIKQSVIGSGEGEGCSPAEGASPEADAAPTAGCPFKGQAPTGSAGCPFKGQAPTGSAGCPFNGQAPTGSGGCPFAAASRQGARGVKDMATRMYTVPDPETGELLPDENILNQVATFLVAGHDSTSTAITMLLYHVALNPEVEEKIFLEVMSVVGDGPITWESLGKMKYCTQVVKENLRLFSPAAQFIKTSPPDQAVTLGPYAIPPGTSFVCSTWGLHRNPAVYPEPTKFDPDRWSDENAAKRSPYAWLPFSYGKRACIGQQLSMIEQRVCLASLVRKFHLRVDLATKVSVTTPLFLDPQGIFLKCVPRSRGVERPLPSALPAAGAITPSEPTDIGQVPELQGKRLVVLFGSNMGTAEDFADRAVSTGQALGMLVEKHPLDRLASGLTLPKSTDGAVIVVTSVYNGQPPDNARRFHEWMSAGADAMATADVRFGVFGCGNKQWAATYMKFPRHVHECFQSLGGTPMVPFGEGDMDGGQAEFSFVQWLVSLQVALMQAHGAQIPSSIKDSMFPKLPVYSVFHKVSAKAEDITLEVLRSNLRNAKRQALSSFLAGNKAFLAEVEDNRELLTTAQGRSTRHIEVRLPEGVSFTAGDHLGVVGANPDEVVFAYMDYLGLAHDAVVRLELEQGQTQAATLPLATTAPAYTVLAYHFELQQLASRAQLYALAKMASEPTEAEHLRKLAESASAPATGVEGLKQSADAFECYVLQARRTLLEVLREHPSVQISAGELLGMLPAMKPRYYSISSSPKHSPGTLSISVSVVHGASPTGRLHLGLCSNFLKAHSGQKSFPPSVMPSLPLGQSGKGMPLMAFVKDTGSAFRLPASNVPVIMVGPGTGVAPMRGFLQDRVADGRLENVLFFGCRDESDFLYREELEASEKAGALQLFVAFSRKQGTTKTYVQDLIEQQAPLLAELIGRGAYVFVCGDASKMAPDVKATMTRLLAAAGLGDDCVEKMSAEGRYCEDVWAAQSV